MRYAIVLFSLILLAGCTQPPAQTCQACPQTNTSVVQTEPVVVEEPEMLTINRLYGGSEPAYLIPRSNEGLIYDTLINCGNQAHGPEIADALESSGSRQIIMVISSTMYSTMGGCKDIFLSEMGQYILKVDIYGKVYDPILYQETIAWIPRSKLVEHGNSSVYSFEYNGYPIDFTQVVWDTTKTNGTVYVEG